MSEERKKYKVLLLDPDEDFNMITANVLRKAGFHLLPCYDSKTAQEICTQIKESEQTIDLMIIARNAGIDFLKNLRLEEPTLPVLVIANDWEKDAINQYLSHSVAGIYKKPINLFSMIDRIKELVFRHFHQDGEMLWQVTDTQAWRPKSFSGASKQSRAFLDKLWENRFFKKILVVENAPYSPIDLIIEDLQNFGNDDSHQWITVETDNLSIENLEKVFSECVGNQSLKFVTFIVEDVSLLNHEQQDLLCEFMMQATCLEEKAFDVRLLLFISNNFDLAYEEGVLSDRFYMSSGSLTIEYPALESCPEEIGYFLQYFLSELATDHSIDDWSCLSNRKVNAIISDLDTLSFNELRDYAAKAFRSILEPEDEGYDPVSTVEDNFNKHAKQFARDWTKIAQALVEDDKSKALEELSITEEEFRIINS